MRSRTCVLFIDVFVEEGLADIDMDANVVLDGLPGFEGVGVTEEVDSSGDIDVP